MGQRRSLPRIVILVVIVVFVLGCGTISQIISPPTPTPLPPTNTPLPPATATPIPTMTPEPSPTPTETPLPTDTPLPTPTELPAMIETELDNGWYLYTLPQEGFSIALPPDWYSFELTGDMAEAATDILSEQNDSQMWEYYEDIMPTLMEQGIKFYGIEFTVEGLNSGFPASINIVQQELLGGMSLDQLAEMSAIMMESMFELPAPVEHDTAELSVGTAERLSYGMEALSMSGEPVDVTLYQYMIESEGDIYIISIGATTDRFEAIIPTFEQIVDSFRFEEQ
jgi:hypothetical protein